MKSTVQEIRARFDVDVERFSSLKIGQAAAMDSPLCMGLIAEAAAAVTPGASHVLDVGCGAGNYTLRLLQELPDLHATLIDLSQPMLDRAAQRVGQATAGHVQTIQADIREAALGEQAFDVIMAAAVLHHLRSPSQWQTVFAKLFRSLRPGGSLWIYDMVTHDQPAVEALMRRRYGQYLVNLRDEAYRDQVFAYIEKEDSPESLTQQLAWMQEAGFCDLQVLHKNGCFAAFGGVRPDHVP